MIHCCVSLDYLSQQERSGHREAGELVRSLRALAASLGGTAGQKDSPLLLSFPDSGPFGKLLAVEAIHRAATVVERASSRTRGASVGIHASADPDDVHQAMTALRFASCEQYSCRMSPEGLAALADRLPPPASRGDAAGWRAPVHALALADADLGALALPAALAGELAAALSPAGARLVATPPSRASRSLEWLRSGLAGTPGMGRVITLRAARTWVKPFSPFVDSIGEDLIREAMEASPPARAKTLATLAPAFRIVARSAFSASIPPSTARGCMAFLDELLDALGDSGAVLLCESPERFSREALDLIAGRLSGERGAERYVALAEAGMPGSWDGPHAAWLEPGGNGAEGGPEAAVERALSGSTGAVRSALRSRALAMAGLSPSPHGGVRAALSVLPPEAALYLYGLLLAEDALAPAETAEFFAELGLGAEGAGLVQDLLVRSGLADPAMRTLPLSPADPESVAAAIGGESAAFMDAKFTSYLMGRYRRGGISPSLGFLRRVGERADEERMVFDCLFEEALGDGQGSAAERSFLSPSSAAALRFWTALHARDRDAAESAAASARDRMEGPRAAALSALVKTELAYAAGDGQRAGLGAREALRAMGKGAPPKLEARAHRMMGLSALAEERYTEGTDYLANAQELSEACHDDYERMMAAYAKAVAEFMNGGLGRALRDAGHAAESASRLFRVDVLAALESLRGRIDLELGAYDEAARRYDALAAMAAEYGLAGAAERATVWCGRALAYAGDYEEAVGLLARAGDDREARVFRGELEILRGRPREARAWLEEPAERATRAFRPPDSFDWTSPLSEIEGRCLAFDAAEAPLSEMRTALSCFARGLDERSPEAVLELYALTRNPRAGKSNPALGTYCFFCFLLEERLPDPPVDKQSVLSRAFKSLQQRAGRIEDRSQRALYMEKNAWNRRLLEAARTHKFI